jgi:transcriptional regulator with XRE-family HTH domain
MRGLTHLRETVLMQGVRNDGDDDRSACRKACCSTCSPSESAREHEHLRSSVSPRLPDEGNGVMSRRRMNADAQRRHQLGEFLRLRRLRRARDEPSLPPVAGRFTGLRREEVAIMAGISIGWYTSLEQGRHARPSRSVLDAVARTLRLTCAEHAYVLSLAGYAARPLADDRTPREGPTHALRLLDVLGDFPAYVAAPDWQIVQWNRAFEALYPTVATVPEDDRNALWLMFTDPYSRELNENWEAAARRLAAAFRAAIGDRLCAPSVAVLIRRLLASSDFFRECWSEHDIEPFTPGRVLLHHPVVGDLDLWHHRLTPAGLPDLHIAIWTPEMSTDTPIRISRMLKE